MSRTEKKGLDNWVIGLIMLVITVVGFMLAFTKNVPFIGGGTEVRAVFNSAQNVRANSPVRIAGVNVGVVKGVEPLASAEDAGDGATAQSGGEAGTDPVQTAGAIVTMELTDDAFPLKEDATFQLRPRLFLEGNLFVDVSPGSPAAPEYNPDSDPFPASHTSNSVQLDQVLTGALQSDSRRNLQTFLDEFGRALIDSGGAEGFRKLYKVSPGAYRDGAIVNDAFLGFREHDLSGVVRNLDKVVRGLGRDETALKDFVTNFRIMTGSFAAEDQNLERAVSLLPSVLDSAGPALDNLNAAFPSLRAFSREALPGTLTAPATLDKATPLIRQLRLLSRPRELRGLAAELRLTIPNLARLNDRTRPFLEQNRTLASCFNNVIIPWSNEMVVPVDPLNTYDHDPVGRIFEETGYGLAGIAGESRSGDANGPYIRVMAGGGINTVETSSQTGATLAGVTPFPILGSMPNLNESAKTNFADALKNGNECENQEVPNLQSSVGGAPTNARATAAAPADSYVGGLETEATDLIQDLARAEQLIEAGDTQAGKALRKDARKRARTWEKTH